jgi:UDP-N-acetylmuramyl tripeptide synthase
MENAKKGDVILITGIGHQTSRIMGKNTLPWVESEVVKDISREF